ncbi:MAG: hypothetical protein QXP53_01010 [Candidatus Pacearchaeota archaeon]
MKNLVRINLTFGMLVAIVILTLSNVSAFGITSPYWKERPLELAPGEIATVTLQLQNMVGNENLRVRAEIINGTEIAEIIDPNKEYYVPLGVKNVTVNIRIIIPTSAPEGKEYTIGVAFTTIKPSRTGGVEVGTSIEKYFPVIIKTPTQPAPVQEKKFPTLLIVVITIVIIVIIFIIWLLTRKKKETRREEKKEEREMGKKK